MSISLTILALLTFTKTVKCQICPRNCLQCTDTYNCTYCSDGFYNGHLYDDSRHTFSNDCSLKCDTHCDACVSYNTCTKCKRGYCSTGDQRRCTNVCNSNCRACFSCDNCTECKAGYYGRSCNMPCGYGCLNHTCDTLSGFCECDKTHIGRRCDQCIIGKFGKRCQYECPRGCVHKSCNANGQCLYGCKPGFIKPYCNECMDGFYGYECEACPENCKTCLSANFCSECQNGYSGSTCDIICPLRCTNCESNGKCSTCFKGFYGLSCSSECPRNCATINCDPGDGYCYTCKSGFWGNYCNLTCGPGCSQNVCGKQNGNCLNGCNKGLTGEKCNMCKNGFYGPNCLPCPSACEECTSATQCSRCSVGFYGQNCSQVCSENCGSRSCSLFNGTCLQCRRGFYGERCEFICPTNCFGNTCSSDGQCLECKVGYFGDKCKKPCSRQCKGSCKRSFGECHHCIDGFFGNNCDKHCPKDCINCMSNTECTLCKTGKKGITCQHNCSNCRNGTKCRKTDGFCNEACADGLSGYNCERPCAVQCKTCQRYSNSKCVSCASGKYGQHQTYNYLTCHLNCRETCLNKSCNEQNGHCLSECKRGYWGTKCEWTCSKMCKNNICSMQSGSCLEGCVEGFFGDRCSHTCRDMDHNCKICGSKLKNQYGGCKVCNEGYFPFIESSNRYKWCILCPLNCKDKECSSKTGVCLHGCRKGYWGKTCKKLCASKCNMCNQRNGICLNCISGSYGDNCLQKCSLDCAGSCERNSGECVMGCATNNKYGSYCDKDCSSNCVNKECNWTTGHCSLACVYGYFGSTCDNSCSKNCRDSSCNRDNGECNIGCIDGFEGSQCVQEVSGSGNTNVIINIVAGVFGLVTVCVLVVILYIRQHKRKKGKHKEDIAAMKSRSDNEDFVDERETDRGDVGIEDFDTGNIYALPKENPLNTKTDRGVTFKQPEMLAACLTKEVSDAEDKFGSRDFVGVDDNDEVETNFDDKTTKIGAVSYQENTYYNAGSVLRRRIELDKLKEFVSKKSKDYFIAEFQELPVGLIKSYEASQKMENRAKNRYRGLYPYDGRRVIIKNGRSDYINASYIDGYMKRNAYIASTGPTVKHMGEDFAIFWEMVWQEHITKIIMLTKLVELGVPKCDQYWPGEGSCRTYGNVVVTCRKENIQKNFTIRTFDIENSTYQEERRTLCQMHFTSWPDKGIPASVDLFTEFYNTANDESIAKATDNPVLVHCSAGVGRSGTYIALDILTTEGRAEGYVDIFACVRNLREERVNMVQTLEQYVYIHKCLVENLTQSDYKPKQMIVYDGEKS